MIPAFALLLLYTASATGTAAWASTPSPPHAKAKLTDQLSEIRHRVMNLQQSLVENMRAEKQATSNYKKIQLLLRLQQTERQIARKRLGELEKTVLELESRRKTLREKIGAQQGTLRKLLFSLDRSTRGEELEASAPLENPEKEKIEAPRRKVLSNLVDRGLKEVEELRVDLADSDQLENRIQEDKGQLAYLLQEVKEQEGVLELNRQLQADFVKKNHQDRLQQLESYHRLKDAESQVEQLISEFNARKELERAVETEKRATRSMMQGAFAKARGRLSLPVAGGQVASSFGRAFDPKSRLQIFKKGIDISGGKNLPVRAIFGGKVAYSGNLPDYGRVVIIDHGDHFYSLCAHLGNLTKKAGDFVTEGEQLGLTDDSGTPTYFEIRSRNVAVNPLQWLSN